MVVATCAGCGETFEATRRDKKYCSDRCRKRVKRTAEPDAPEPDPTVTDSTGLVDAIRRELADADRIDTYPGQLAMQLARRLVSPEESGISSLSKELRTVMDAALSGTTPPAEESEDDEVTKARRRRDEIAREASGRA